MLNIMDEDTALATISLIILIIMLVIGCLVIWFKSRYNREDEYFSEV